MSSLPPLSSRRDASSTLPPMRGDVQGPPEAPPADRELNRTSPPRTRRAGTVGVVTAVLAAGVVGGVIGSEFGGGGSSPPPATSVAAAAGTASAKAAMPAAVATAAPSVVLVRTAAGLGSGVVLSDRGLVVTNHHVIAGNRRVAVITADHRDVPARVLLDDSSQDLAILKPAASVGTGATLATEPNGGLSVGDQVFAIGSPFGLQGTVTSGIVSYVNRPGEGNGPPMIQTDAPINPGNSGGGLFDLKGRLVGIPTSIRAPIAGNVGIGFALPVSRVSDLLQHVR